MNVDVHAPYVKQLAAAGDWAALARYWIAHQHEPALDAAIACASARASDDPRWRELPEYLARVKAEPLDPTQTPPAALVSLAGTPENATLGILGLNPRAALCELAGQFPTGHQERLLGLGLESAQEAAKLSLSCADRALAAFYGLLLARGLRELRQLEQAGELYRQSLDLYRELARQRPEVYGPDVAMTLNNLGNVQSDLNDLEAARASYEEASALYAEAALRSPTAGLPERLRTGVNLGRLLRREDSRLGWPLYGAARDAFRAARRGGIRAGRRPWRWKRLARPTRRRREPTRIGSPGCGSGTPSSTPMPRSFPRPWRTSRNCCARAAEPRWCSTAWGRRPVSRWCLPLITSGASGCRS